MPRRVDRSMRKRGLKVSKPSARRRFAEAMCSCFGFVRAQYHAMSKLLVISTNFYREIQSTNLKIIEPKKLALFLFHSRRKIYRGYKYTRRQSLSVVAGHDFGVMDYATTGRKKAGNRFARSKRIPCRIHWPCRHCNCVSSVHGN